MGMTARITIDCGWSANQMQSRLALLFRRLFVRRLGQRFSFTYLQVCVSVVHLYHCVGAISTLACKYLQVVYFFGRLWLQIKIEFRIEFSLPKSKSDLMANAIFPSISFHIYKYIYIWWHVRFIVCAGLQGAICPRDPCWGLDRRTGTQDLWTWCFIYHQPPELPRGTPCSVFLLILLLPWRLSLPQSDVIIFILHQYLFLLKS